MSLHRLPSTYRRRLKKPWGELLVNPVKSDQISSGTRFASLVVTVGDASAEILTALGRTPDIFVVDALEMRVKRKAPEIPYKREFKVRNPPAHISDEAVEALMKALDAEKPVRILVDGEEDLLSLPVMAYYPKGTVLFYGQPCEGLVMVNVDEQRVEAIRFLEALGVPRQAPGLSEEGEGNR